MVAGQQDITVVLTRDSPNTPWGFRLQGGQEVNCSITVQRVFVGGLSDGKLQRGDVIVGIEGHNAETLYHSEAESIIKSADRQLTMSVRRGGDYQSSAPPSYNEYSGHQQYASLGRDGSYPFGQQSPSRDELGRSTLGAGDDDENYSRSVKDLKQVFASSPQSYSGIRHNVRAGSTSYVPKRPVFVKPTVSGNPGGLAEPGWVPTNKPYPHSQSRYGPSGLRSPPINRQGNENPMSHYSSPPPPQQRTPAERPAWYGSLRSSGGPKGWELQEQEAISGGGPKPPMQDQRHAVQSRIYPGGGEPQRSSSPVVVHNPKVQSLRYGPGGDSPVYGQNEANNGDSDTAKVAHLQYNTPIGLYSKENALEALRGQTHGKPGEGTLTISGTGETKPPFSPPGVQSDLYRMIREEEEQAKRGGSRPSGRRPVSSGMRRAPRSNSPPVFADHKSDRFQQLVNENGDQMANYTNMSSGIYGPGAYGPSVNVRHSDQGISDF